MLKSKCTHSFKHRYHELVNNQIQNVCEKLRQTNTMSKIVKEYAIFFLTHQTFFSFEILLQFTQLKIPF